MFNSLKPKKKNAWWGKGDLFGHLFPGILPRVCIPNVRWDMSLVTMDSTCRVFSWDDDTPFTFDSDLEKFSSDITTLDEDIG